MKLILRWIINAVAVWVAALLLDGITIEGNWFDLFLVGLVMGLVNAIIKPILKLLALPITIVTLGLFTLVINAGMLALVAWIMPTLAVDGFITALLGGILISIVSTLLNWFIDN
jgi:putative membrane protein